MSDTSDTADSSSYWITGATRSGKTYRLVQQIGDWSASIVPAHRRPGPTDDRGASNRGFLVFAASGDNRIDLADRIESATGGRSPFDSTTPLGFFQSELILFWPLVAQQLQLQTQFPLRLRPETEQLLATRLWQSKIDQGELVMEGVRDYYVVRRTLDLLQLAASSGLPIDEIPSLLAQGYGSQKADLWAVMGDALQTWRTWCLERGLLTYGLISDLYSHVLLPQASYQRRLCQRYQAVLADDVDEYPAIAHDVFSLLLDRGIPGCFTFNPDGAMRLGLGADPDALSALAARCQVEELVSSPESSLGATWGPILWAGVQDPFGGVELPDTVRSLQTTSRAELLRTTAEVIHTAVQAGEVEPQDIAVVGPGLDAIARYTLRQILNHRGIAVTVVNDQQPLASGPTIRALMTLMALVYPGLGRLIDRDAIAEMLVVLSQRPSFDPAQADTLTFAIDPARAGLITDYCFKPDPIHPELLPVHVYDRWDRLGYQATESYQRLRQWLEAQQQQQQQRLIATPVVLLDRAIQHFLLGGSHLPYDQLAALRELMETAQHFWEVEARLRQKSPTETPVAETVASFIQLLRDGTITADPYPVRPVGAAQQTVTLATLFQYRANRGAHRWQFWLDAGSNLWLTGGTPLFGAPLLIRGRPLRAWSAVEELEANQDRLRRNLLDIMGRATERIYLCHSELATSGQEQNGPLLTLVNAALPVEQGAIA